MMSSTTEMLEKIFFNLNARISEMNHDRRREGLLDLPKAEVALLGQMSLLAQERVAAVLALTQTVDLDAKLKMDHIIKLELKSLLAEANLTYDEDSHLIWLPKTAKFLELFDFACVAIKCVDAESALVSKAVKAPTKNKVLIRQAIASGEFPNLAKHILEHGGKLENFL